MAIQLDHIIVPSRNRVDGARHLAGLLDAPWGESQGNFSPVYVSETLTLDFADREQFESHHVCFRVSDGEFDAILARVLAAKIPYRSSPRGANDMEINRPWPAPSSLTSAAPPRVLPREARPCPTRTCLDPLAPPR